MPVEFTIDPAMALVHVVGTGAVTRDEIIACTTAAVRTWAPVAYFDVLIDVTGMESFLTYDDLLVVFEEVEHAASFHPRYAIVANRVGLIGGMHLWQIWAERLGIQVLITRSEAAALEWLGKPSDGVGA